MVFEKVYEIVRKIPQGKVTTYGAISKILKINPRVVGWALHKNSNPTIIPCHRVVNKEGKLAKGFAFGGQEGHRKKLVNEGIEVIEDRIDLKKYFWKF